MHNRISADNAPPAPSLLKEPRKGFPEGEEITARPES